METIIEQHPWIKDAKKELARVKKEQDRMMEDGYGNGFPDKNGGDGNGAQT